MKHAYFILALAASFTRAESLDDILRRMDQAAQKFRSLSADVHKTDYSDLFKESPEEDGTFKMMKRPKTGVVLLAEFTGRNLRKLYISGNQLKKYSPKANSVEIYDTRKFTKSVELYLLVGFGTTRAELEKTYTISLGGSETIGKTKTSRIDLTPKKEEAQKVLKKIELWIPDGESNPIQEKILQGKEGKDYILLELSNVKIHNISDPPLPASDFELILPAGVKEIRP